MLMSLHLAVLPILLPMIGAPLAALLGRSSWAWWITLIISIGQLLCFVAMLPVVLGGQPLDYSMGGWAIPWGIAYRVDALSLFMGLLIAAIAVLTCVYAKHSLRTDVDHEKLPYAYCCMQLCVMGLLGMVLTADIFNLFVFLEISSLATYGLVSLGKDRRALLAAFRYLVTGTLGATLFLIGVGLAYTATGTLNLEDMAQKFATSPHQRTIQGAFAFIFAGLVLKIAIFPLHLWLPTVYRFAPSAVAVLLAATATKVALYVLVRCQFGLFGQAISASHYLAELLLVGGVLAMLYCSYLALKEDDFKGLLAYSSLAHLGYMLGGMGLLSAKGLSASLMQLFAHTLAKGGLFMLAGIMVLSAGTSKISQLTGLAGRSPLLFLALVICGLSLVGVPGTVGFVGKWQLLDAALTQGRFGLVLAILASSLMALAYVWKILETAYSNPQSNMQLTVKPGWLMPLSMWSLTLGCLYFGFFSQWPWQLAQHAATVLWGSS
ncbi:monovalent cation/H+ antiporter subunit D family protein [Aliiglaciecola sp. CAU 1673]|uniref:monovalent cation/H+ antiporter subunit D family protein n=1 Tax=Aliiglaciecola sp. CAU 1673 TaxID=3032595 RepID=UPI0023DBC0B7|nr:monovalent cation/H+ antiporter subunit D family protein [Aliiglaciecola sp. CAU 1673]MDF2179845.1 monovalent cation/H+ antiporter subunit D family protein [Aliiglaciecola sp. CAU 1673]